MTTYNEYYQLIFWNNTHYIHTEFDALTDLSVRVFYADGVFYHSLGAESLELERRPLRTT